MAHSVGIDFGTSNTVIARWSTAAAQSELVGLKSSDVQQHAQGEAEDSFFVPSAVWRKDEAIFIGKEATRRSTRDYLHRNFKREILNGLSSSPLGVGLTQAFLSEIFSQLGNAITLSETHLALTIPNGASEEYTRLLVSTAEHFEFAKVSVLHEPLAAAIGTRTDLLPGEEALFFDCGAGTTDVTWVRFLEGEKGIKVIGRGSQPRRFIAGNDVDKYVAEEILKTCDTSPPAALVGQYATKIKENLAFNSYTEIKAIDEDSSFQTHRFSLSQERLIQVLNRRDFYSNLWSLIESAIENGESPENSRAKISHIFFTGGSSQLPNLVSDLTERTSRFLGRDIQEVFVRPFTAVARGACAYAHGFHLEDLAPKDYYILHRDISESGWIPTRIVSEADPCPMQDIWSRKIKRLESRLRIAVFEASAAQANFFLDSSQRIDPRSLNFQRTFKEIGHVEHEFSTDACTQFSMHFDLDETRCLYVRLYDLNGNPTINRQPVCRISRHFKG